MNFVFDYLLHTSWSDKKSDLAQYVQLCKSLRAEKDFCNAARKNIVFKAGCNWMLVEGNKHPQKCIAECNTLIDGDKGIRTQHHWQCPEYSDVEACKRVCCPNAVYQAEYVAAQQRLKIAQEKHDMFLEQFFNQKEKGSK